MDGTLVAGLIAFFFVAAIAVFYCGWQVRKLQLQNHSLEMRLRIERMITRWQNDELEQMRFQIKGEQL